MIYIRLASYMALVVALALVVMFCTADRNAVTGTITFDGDQSIPSGTVLTVELRDVSYQDASSILIASQTIEGPERFPIEFAVPYDPDRIDSGAVYGLQISIRLQDRLLYVNDTAFDVLTRGNPGRGVDVWVIAVGGG